MTDDELLARVMRRILRRGRRGDAYVDLWERDLAIDTSGGIDIPITRSEHEALVRARPPRQ